MCLRSCAAILLLSCCWPWLASADGSGGQLPATWAQLDNIWNELQRENEQRSQRLGSLESTSSLLVTNLIRSEELRSELSSELKKLRAELVSLRDSFKTQSRELDASEIALQTVEQELTKSQDSLRLVDESLRTSARSAFVRDLLIGAGALGAGLLIGILVN